MDIGQILELGCNNKRGLETVKGPRLKRKLEERKFEQEEDFEDETVEDFKDDKEVLPTSAGLGVDFPLPTYDRVKKGMIPGNWDGKFRAEDDRGRNALETVEHIDCLAGDRGSEKRSEKNQKRDC